MKNASTGVGLKRPSPFTTIEMDNIKVDSDLTIHVRCGIRVPFSQGVHQMISLNISKFYLSTTCRPIRTTALDRYPSPFPSCDDLVGLSGS